MKSVIVYGTFQPSGATVYTAFKSGLHVRCVTVVGDAVNAINKAKPRKGETVLNTMEIPK